MTGDFMTTFASDCIKGLHNKAAIHSFCPFNLQDTDRIRVGSHEMTSNMILCENYVLFPLSQQVSNFLLFQMAYTELFFVDKLWPDITRRDVLDIFEAYKTRTRRCATNLMRIHASLSVRRFRMSATPKA